MKRKSLIFIKLLPSIELDYIHIYASDELFNFLSISMDGSSCHMLFEFFLEQKNEISELRMRTILRFSVSRFFLFVCNRLWGCNQTHTQTLLSHAFHSNDFEFTFVWAPKFCFVNFYYYDSSWTVLRSNRAGPKKILLGIRRRRCPFSSSQYSIHNQNWSCCRCSKTQCACVSFYKTSHSFCILHTTSIICHQSKGINSVGIWIVAVSSV